MGADTIIDMVKRIKPLMGVQFPQEVLSDGDVDYRLGRSSFKAEDKVQVLTSLLNGVIY